MDQGDVKDSPVAGGLLEEPAQLPRADVGDGLSELEENTWVLEGMNQALPQPVVYHELLWRDWEDFDDLETPRENNFDFTVLSYNILSQDLVDHNSNLYLHCDPSILCWEYRWQNILQELQHWEADVLCLQEVQENHYKEQVLPSLSALGYSCHYKRRTGRKTDGCCTCYKTHRFTLLSENHVEFFRPGIDLLNRDNVGLVLLLQPRTSDGMQDSSTFLPLCVANTHLLYNPKRGDIKLVQLALLLAEIHKVSQMPNDSHCPIILCGDMNATPFSPFYRLLRNGVLNYWNLPTWKVSGQEKFCTQPYPRLLPLPLWPDDVGVTDHCQYVLLAKKTTEAKPKDILRYNRKSLLQLRYCECACQRPPDLVFIKGVTDHEPDPLSEPINLDPPTVSTDFLMKSLLLQHNLNLTSVYSHFLPAKNRPEVTSFPMGVGNTVDYIFYSAEPLLEGSTTHGVRFYEDKHLKLLGRLSLLSEDDLWAAQGLPNPFLSSDHLCLLARFSLERSSS
ncbi:protein angel homolog 1 [Bombina bombina]|uniref:protein angel homolog 1 n=1 Tax=Bombina bombina TaxID=8345 RepID=UPI00235A9BF5|nr:protein angel homolog 1 [Bombina bombina]